MKVAVIYGFAEPAQGDGGGLRQLAQAIKAQGCEVEIFEWDDARVFDSVYDVVIGHSYGGHQAIRYGNRLPGIVGTKLILLDPVPQNYWFMLWRLHRFRSWARVSFTILRSGRRWFPYPSQEVTAATPDRSSVLCFAPLGLDHNTMRASPVIHRWILSLVEAWRPYWEQERVAKEVALACLHQGLEFEDSQLEGPENSSDEQIQQDAAQAAQEEVADD